MAPLAEGTRGAGNARDGGLKQHFQLGDLQDQGDDALFRPAEGGEPLTPYQKSRQAVVSPLGRFRKAKSYCTEFVVSHGAVRWRFRGRSRRRWSAAG